MPSINTGAKSKQTTDTESLREAWNEADERNRNEPQRDGSVWIPCYAVEIDEEILPRFRVDNLRVMEYREITDQLPPILVQDETYLLIDGHHRLDANIEAENACIRVLLVKKNGDDILDLAFEQNARTGVPLTSRERREAATRKIARNPEMSAALLARWAGISVRTAQDIKSGLADRPEFVVDINGNMRAMPVRAGRINIEDDEAPHVTEHATDPKLQVDPELADDEWVMPSHKERPPILDYLDALQNALEIDPGAIFSASDDKELSRLVERFSDLKKMSDHYFDVAFRVAKVRIDEYYGVGQ